MGIKELTQRQREIYDFIKNFLKESGYPPTIREISENFGFSSPTGALVHIEALKNKGYIKREHASRGIKIIEKTPFEINFAEVIGNINKSGKIVKSENIIHIPLPSSEKALLAAKSLIDINEFGILKGDYVIFSKGKSVEGLTLIFLESEYMVGYLNGEDLKDLNGKKLRDYDLKGVFYGILRIPEERDIDE